MTAGGGSGVRREPEARRVAGGALTATVPPHRGLEGRPLSPQTFTCLMLGVCRQKAGTEVNPGPAPKQRETWVQVRLPGLGRMCSPDPQRGILPDPAKGQVAAISSGRQLSSTCACITVMST